MSNLNKPFIYVEDDNIESFINDKDSYTDKIAFLGTSGKIATKGQLYGGGETDTVLSDIEIENWETETNIE